LWYIGDGWSRWRRRRYCFKFIRGEKEVVLVGRSLEVTEIKLYFHRLLTWQRALTVDSPRSPV
jgi:hypothetical protein